MSGHGGGCAANGIALRFRRPPWTGGFEPRERHLSTDIVYLKDLRIETVIGIYDWEREIKQTVVLDLEMATDVARAAATDRIEDALNYKSIAKRVIEFVGAAEFQLVETLAERTAEILIEEFDVPWLRLTVNKKGAVRGARDVGVIIERTRAG